MRANAGPRRRRGSTGRPGDYPRTCRPPPRVRRRDAQKKTPSAAEDAEHTIDELAREGGRTVRNVRAYQDRGLLLLPLERGRTGWYSRDHLSRLRLIGSLLSRGYTLSNIGELINALERGHDLRLIVGLERAISSPGRTSSRACSPCPS